MAKILLVEDDKSLREIYGVRLLAEGYDIVSAGDGEEALAMAIKDRPDLIVSDVMMPKISGFDMLDILRSTTETRDIKVIMMNALSSDDQRQRGEQLGADRYLVKSQVGIEDVVRTVHEVLGDVPNAAPAANAFAPPAPSAVPTPQPAAPTAEPPAPETPAPAMTQPLASAAPAALAPQPTADPAPVAPQPAAAPEPIAPPAPTADTSATPVPSSLPQPTAPFSTSRPATLGERVIQPLEKPAETGPAIADLMDQELQASATLGSATSPLGQPAPEPAGPAPQPTADPAPAAIAAPQPPAPEPIASPPSPAPVMDNAPLNYEETPSAAPVAPQPPTTQQPPAAL